MKKRVRVDATLEVKGAPSFYSDCREAKRKAKHLLKVFRRTNLDRKEKGTDTSNRNKNKQTNKKNKKKKQTNKTKKDWPMCRYEKNTDN